MATQIKKHLAHPTVETLSTQNKETDTYKREPIHRRGNPSESSRLVKRNAESQRDIQQRSPSSENG